MTITIPDNLLLNLSTEDVLEDLATALYQQEKITLAQGAEMLSVSIIAFQKKLAQRQINIHYDIEDLAVDIQNLKK
jgi:predicted HTH domain antitoxin